MPDPIAKKPGPLKKRIRLLNRQISRAKHRVKVLTIWRRKRKKQLAAAQAHGKPRALFVKFLLDHRGAHEDSGRPNRAAWLDAWARHIGSWMLGQPWCGLTVWMAARAAGVALTPETVSTNAIIAHAKAGTGGFKRWHPVESGYQPKPGDVPVYGDHSTGAHHTGGTITAGRNGAVVEGNTSPGSGGSQNNGGGCYQRSTAQRLGWTLGWAEIDWSKAR